MITKMAYSTQLDLEAKVELSLLVQLTDDNKSGSLNPIFITKAISGADAVINSYLRGKYVVPLSPVPEVINELSSDIALFNLYSRRSAYFELPKSLSDKYKTAISMLKDMRDGKQDLGVEPPPPPSEAIVAEVSGPGRLFTEDSMKDF